MQGSDEVARGWQSKDSNLGCPTPVRVRTPFTAQLLVRKKGGKERAFSVDGCEEL